MADRTEPSLRVDSVELRRSSTVVLRDVSFFLDGPQVVLLCGPNGSGKSTLLETLALLRRCSAGTATLDGRSLTEPSNRRLLGTRISYLAQAAAFPGSFTAHAFLQYQAHLFDVPSEQRERRIGEAAEALDVSPLLGRRLARLSGGERQRVFVAGTLTASPSLVLLDEPTAGLDDDSRVALQTAIRRIGTEAIVIVTSHLVDDRSSLGDRVLELRDGTLLDHVGDRSEVDR
ncbi:MAG: ATP-binding cassette domain-containing protein [Actinobacteria bacterium]|nr:ATP-binding cassette domain-containing protein [Actinomycetota bacterium]